MDHSSWAVTLGSLTCREGGNLSTRDLGFIHISSAGWVGCEFLHPAQPTDAPSSRRSSRSHLYTPGFLQGWPPLRGLVPLGRRNLVPILPPHTLHEGGFLLASVHVIIIFALEVLGLSEEWIWLFIFNYYSIKKIKKLSF